MMAHCQQPVLPNCCSPGCQAPAHSWLYMATRSVEAALPHLGCQAELRALLLFHAPRAWTCAGAADICTQNIGEPCISVSDRAAFTCYLRKKEQTLRALDTHIGSCHCRALAFGSGSSQSTGCVHRGSQHSKQLFPAPCKQARDVMTGACLGVLQHSQGRLLTMLPRSSTLPAMEEQSVSSSHSSKLCSDDYPMQDATLWHRSTRQLQASLCATFASV